MRHSFAKLMALLMVLTLALSGCNLIDVDKVALIGQDRAKLEKDYATVLAEYEGGTVTKFDALAPFYSNYNYMYQLYSSFGMNFTADMATELLQSAVESEVQSYAIRQQFLNRGLTMEETEEEIRAEADESYQSSYDSALESVEGDTPEEKAAYAELALYSEGFTRERLFDMMLASHQAEAVQQAVEGEITEVTDEELQAAYDEKVAADTETYTEAPTQFETDASNSSNVICWRPEGYRTVKHVLVIPEEEILQAVTDARNALKTAKSALEDLQNEMDGLNDDEPAEGEEVRTVEEIQADLDAKNAEIQELESSVAAAEEACLASVKDKTDEVYAKLEAGEKFDDVMAEYGEDPGMQSEPSMTDGYYVCADSTRWDANFTAGAMALTAVGDYSDEPVISASGVHIIYYNADVPEGTVSLEEIHDALYDETLETMKSEHYQSELSSWIEALNPVYHLDAWTFE